MSTLNLNTVAQIIDLDKDGTVVFVPTERNIQVAEIAAAWLEIGEDVMAAALLKDNEMYAESSSYTYIGYKGPGNRPSFEDNIMSEGNFVYRHEMPAKLINTVTAGSASSGQYEVEVWYFFAL